MAPCNDIDQAHVCLKKLGVDPRFAWPSAGKIEHAPLETAGFCLQNAKSL